MPIQVPCDCGKQYKVADELLGKRFKCKSCGDVLTVEDPADDEFGFMDVDVEEEFANAQPLPAAPPRKRRAKKSSASAPAFDQGGYDQGEPYWTVGRVFKKFFGVLALGLAALIVLGMVLMVANGGGGRPRAYIGGGFFAFAVGSVGARWLFLE